MIIGKINGYGSESDRVAYDLILQAETGFMSINGTLDSGPIKTAFIDKSNQVTTEKLKDYKKGLSKLISEILSKNIQFKEKLSTANNR